MRRSTPTWSLLFTLASCQGGVGSSPISGRPAVQDPRAFRASISRVKDSAELRWSWRPGCPVAIEDLRVLRADHWTFEGTVSEGALIVHEDVAESMRSVLEKLFALHYPIARMEPIDVYEGDDDRSMAANNSSAFNCRSIKGKPGEWSEHAFGRAIDLNPVQNPYVRDGVVTPAEGRRYLDRRIEEPGVIHDGDAVVRAFEEIGWSWGGRWKTLQDYQHFSRTGR